MSKEDSLRLLIQKRNTQKNHINIFDDFQELYNAETDLGELQIRLQNIYKVFSNFDDVNDEIVILDHEIDHSEKRSNIQKNYFRVTSKAQSLIPTYLPQIILPNVNNNNLNTSVSNETNLSENQVTRRKIKLPRASLPSFTGRYEEWISFKHSFSTLIRDNEELSNIEKLQYLRSSLKDEALKKIQVLPITEDNYERAWNLLERSYDDFRMLISRHMSLLLHLPMQDKENAKGLMTLADESQQHVQSLATLGVELTPEIVVQIIEDKLHKNTLEKWEETLKRGEYPRLEELIDFLYQTASRLTKRKNEFDKNQEPNCKQPKMHGKGHALVAKTKKCSHCSESHFIWRCEKFLKLSVPDRVKTIKSLKLCYTCLGSHLGKSCKFGTCPKCNKRHNPLLHLETDDTKNDTNNS